MKIYITLSVLLAGIIQAQALVISEVMSNPTGEDSGREWIEIYNETDEPLDVSRLTVSIKGGTPIAVSAVSTSATMEPHAYAIIASILSNSSPQTRFLDAEIGYPSYAGVLLKVAKSIALVNTGTSSIDIKLDNVTVATLASYSPAKDEGTTLSLVDGRYVAGKPTPGEANQAADVSVQIVNATTTDTQVTIPQMTPPTADIVIYMPEDKVAVAGAESEFSVFSMTRAGKPLNDLRYSWAFGDGGQGTGSSTKYAYVYSGRYIAQVEATSATVAGKGRMTVRVIPPDLTIVSFGSGKYGSYVEIRNPNSYDIDLSQWMLTVDGAAFPFPRNTLLPANNTTRFSGVAMGFASTTIATSTAIKILFPNLEEVARYVPPSSETVAEPQLAKAATPATTKIAARPQPKVLGVATSAKIQSTNTSTTRTNTKDKRLVEWLKSFFYR